MYSVSKLTHPCHGDVIVIDRQENGKYDSPERAVSDAILERRLWKESGQKKIRFLVDNQLLTTRQVQSWAREEYKNLPKCAWCVSLLDGDVYTHQFCKSNLFCSQACADKDYEEQVEKLKDEEEIDYL